MSLTGMNASPEIVLIVAIAETGVIGQGSQIPWRLKTDQQRFRALTMGKPMVMGRKTFESFPKPLPGRTHIVLTRDEGYRANGAVVTTSFDHAREVARGEALRRFATEIAVIGGAEIYKQWMAFADRLEITEVHAPIEGNIVFKPDLTDWEEVARVRNPAGPDDNFDFSYVTLRRKAQKR